MSLAAKLDIASFQRQIRDLAKITGRTVGEELDGQGRLFVRDCVTLTPPFTPGRNFLDSPAAQRRVGIKATGEQVKKAFTDLRKLDMYNADSAAGKYLRRLTREGRWEELNQALKKFGIRAAGVARKATSADHKLARNRQGRVTKDPRRIFVVDERSIAALVRAKTKRVGLAKGGWVKAAQGLGLKLPNWITDKSRSGVFTRGRDPTKPYIVVGNVVPYIQQSGAELRIMDRALKNRQRNLPKQVESALKAKLKRYGAR